MENADKQRPKPKESLKGNAISNVAVMLLGILVTLLLTPKMMSYLGPDRYGMWTLASSLVGYFSIFQFGLTTSIFRYIPHYRALGDNQRVGQIVSTSLVVYLGIGAFACAIAIPAAGFLAGFYGGGAELKGLITVIALGFGMDLPGMILNTAVKAYEGFTFTNVLGGAMLLLRLALLLLCMRLGYGLVAMGLVLVMIRLISLVGQWYAYNRICDGAPISLRNFSASELKNLMVFGGVVTVATTANSFAIEAPKQIVGKLLSLEAVGLFGVAVMVLGYLRQLVFSLTRVLCPRFSQLTANQRDSEVVDLFMKSSRYVALASSALCTLTIVCGPQFLRLWTGKNEMSLVSGALVVMALGNAVLLSNRVSSDLFLSTGNVRLLSALELVEAVLILVLTVPLTAKFGITGAGIGMSLPFALVRGLWQPVEVCKLLGLRVGAYQRSCMLGSWGIMAAIVLLWYFIEPMIGARGWVALIVLSGVVAAAYAFAGYKLVLNPAERCAIASKMQVCLKI